MGKERPAVKMAVGLFAVRMFTYFGMSRPIRMINESAFCRLFYSCHML